jgi:hypothetical protein
MSVACSRDRQPTNIAGEGRGVNRLRSGYCSTMTDYTSDGAMPVDADNDNRLPTVEEVAEQQRREFPDQVIGDGEPPELADPAGPSETDD